MFAVNGILFNHESPRRGETFVTRKITRAVGAIVRGEEVIMPRGDTVVRANDRVIICALAGLVKKVEKMFSVRLEFF